MDHIRQRVMHLSSQGLSCSQILLALALEDQGRGNPELIQAMAGLAMGCGTGEATCGVLTGAACVLGLYAGGGGAAMEPSPALLPLLAQLHQWFIRAAAAPPGEISCQALLGPTPDAASVRKCTELVILAHLKVRELLAARGLGPPRP